MGVEPTGAGIPRPLHHPARASPWVIISYVQVWDGKIEACPQRFASPHCCAKRCGGAAGMVVMIAPTITYSGTDALDFIRGYFVD